MNEFPHSLHIPAFLNIFILEWSQGILSWSPGAQRNGWRRADRTTTHELLALYPQLLQLEDHLHISKLKLRLALPQLVPQGLVSSPLAPNFSLLASDSLQPWLHQAMETALSAGLCSWKVHFSPSCCPQAGLPGL